MRPPCRTRPSRPVTAPRAATTGALTLGALAARRRVPRTADRVAGIGYSATWANRLSADLPVYPDARVVEAAGTSRASYALRVASFASAARIGKVVDWYFTRTIKVGYSADHWADGRQHMLAGTRGTDAYVVYASPRAGGGTDIDLVVNADT